MLYASLEDAKRELEALQATVGTLSVNDQQMIGKLRTVSKRVDQVFPQTPPWPFFAPWIGTLLQSVSGERVNSLDNTLQIDRFLLELAGTVSVNGSNLSSAATYPDPSYPPFKRLRLTDSCANWYNACTNTNGYAPPLASIPGVWGFNSDYANAWLAIDALATAITTTGQTTFTVADADGADIYGVTWRFSPGNLIKIESEFLEVLLVNPATNTITVRRAANGSTAAVHNTVPTTIYRWEVEQPVKTAVARQAAMQYHRRGAFTTVEVQGMSEVRYPADWLNEVYATLQGYVYV